MKKALGAFTATLLSTASVQAQDAPVFALDEIIFSAGLTVLEASRTGASVAVVTGEELQESGDIQLSDYLATLPGVSISQNGPIGSNTSIRIRGLGERYIPVLIDGIDVTDPSGTQTAFNFGSLTTSALSRIEVLYGSQSALYGSEAIAGVISITTLQAPDEIGTEVTISAEAGSYDTYLGSIGVASRFERGELAFSATRLITDGFSAADENLGNTEDDGHDSTTLTLTGAFDVTDNLRLGFSGFFEDSFAEFDGSGGAGGDGSQTGETRRRAGRVYAEFNAFGIDHEIAAIVSDTDRYFPIGFTQNFEGQRRELTYKGTASLGNGGVLVFGAETSEEEFSADAINGRYDINSVYGDLNTPLTPDLDLSASLRFDDHSVYGGQTTGRIALAWRPTPDMIVRVSYGTGFRAPSLFELFSAFGNPALQPEQSRSAELGVEQDFGRLTLGGTLFHTEIDDLIQFSGGSYTQVPGTSTSRGVEVTMDYEITDSLRLFGTYTYTDARDRNDDRLIRVPEHDISLGVTGEFAPGWSGTFTVQHVMDRLDSDFPDIVPMPDYTLANLTITREINETSEVYLRVNNLFDEDYQTTRGYGTSDRAFYVGLRARF
ncbi:TonB-dependent receptor [Rhodophyticola sp. CCM32]|uniref:TonB-dependent receptor plug domain-containing protein n=1 Tax=Rhodophyticola sp. CCM32 TaxID=2916397 RepID=UPI00107F9388|nr:TonB-dependent receptor [Rhodophyticola sp. CCM32]QBY01869.1 TonB-dependent receptor [Rhodophyticola sp. CCM32]